MIKILVIAALQEELQPFLNLIGSEEIRKLPNQEEYYYKITNEFGKEVELFCAVHPDYSKVSCACHTSRMMSSFNADIALMIGICAGDEAKVTLGDVIVSKKIIDYETGKIEDNEFFPEIKSYEVKNQLKQFVNRFLINNPKIINDSIEYNVHFATIATGTRVIEKNTIFKELKKYDRKILGLDMEAYAFSEAVVGLNHNSYVLVIKSVCDYANSEKNDGYHSIAAENSSRWAYNFLNSFIINNEFNASSEEGIKYQLELQLPALTIEDRDQWYNILRWDNEDEDFLKQRLGNTSGITFYPVSHKKYLVEIIVGMHAYQESYCYYLINLLPSTLEWKALSFMSLMFPNDSSDYEIYISEVLCGYVDFDLDDKELSVYYKSRGLGDGSQYRYKISDNGDTELVEARLLTLNEEAFHNEDVDIFNEPIFLDINSIKKQVAPLRIG